MKKLWIGLWALAGLVLLITPAYAQDDNPPTPSPSPSPSPTPTLAVEQVGDEVPFNLLGYTEEILFGPFDTFTYTFSLPANWEVTSAAEVRLAFNVFTSGQGTVVLPDGTPVAEIIDGSLQIFFNGELVDTILLEQSGERVETIIIPVTALQAVNPGESHQLIVELDAGGSCDEFDLRTRVAIHSYSKMTFPHTVTEPVTSLALLPRPIYQNSFLPDQALLIIPDNPTQSELQAAMAVASGFGGMTNGNLLLSLRASSQVSTDELSANHVIMVGKAESLPWIGSVNLPAGADSAAFSAAGAQPGDGVVQMAVSPWNASNVVLVATGMDDEGVLKAGKAISTGQLLSGDQENLSLVANVRPDAAIAVETRLDQTLGDLGYSDKKLWRVGFSATEYRFYIPPGKTLDDGAYFDLILSHSKLLNYDLSGLVISVNGKDVGSVKFSDLTADYAQVRVVIPTTTVFTGYNKLRINAELIPNNYCVDPNLGSTWVRIWPESTLHMPLVDSAVSGVMAARFDLGDFPSPFTLDPVLGTTALVLPQGDPQAWDVAAQVAFYLGDVVNPNVSDITAYYADSVPEEIKGSRHLMLIGVPSTLPLLSEFNDALPSPVDMASNTVSTSVLQVDYRIPAGSSMGYIELMTSPWNSNNVLVAVLGNSAEGVRFAGTALTDGNLRAGLAGNFSLVLGTQVLSADTRPATSDFATTASLPGAGETSPLVAQPTEPIQGRPAWVLPAMGVALGGMLLVIIFAAIGSLRRRSPIRRR